MRIRLKYSLSRHYKKIKILIFVFIINLFYIHILKRASNDLNSVNSSLDSLTKDGIESPDGNSHELSDAKKLGATHETQIVSQDFDPEGSFYVWPKDVLGRTGYSNFRNLSSSEMNHLSVLGRRLFLHEDVGVPKIKKSFVIYIYKFGVQLHGRFINRYMEKRFDPFEDCSVNNCRITYEEEFMDVADAVLFHLHLLPGPPKDLVRTNFNQRWVWMSDESLFNTFVGTKDKNIDHYDNFFNWSMTYRLDSDVPVPYGRAVPLIGDNRLDTDFDVFSTKTKSVAFMSSICPTRNGRGKYVQLLQKFVEVDTYGMCGKIPCEGHFQKDCPLLNDYKFYLAFENSNCKDYITEKAWWNALEKQAVPIVMGTSRDNYAKLLPPLSFIHVDDFESPQLLAEYIKYLSENKDAYNLYHAWRKTYKVVNEHGYFQSSVYHYCRLCEALNYNDPSPQTYTSMRAFWNVARDCNVRNYFDEFTYYS